MMILLDHINIALIIATLLNFFLGILIYQNGKKKKINIIYTLNIVAIIGWVVIKIIYRSSLPGTDLFWATLLYIAPTLIASSFLYFTYIFPSQKEKNIALKTFNIFFINLIMIVIIVWPGLMIKEVNIPLEGEKEAIFTLYYIFYFLYILCYFTFGFHRLFRKYLKSAGIERLQIIYLLAGYAIAANLAFVTNLVMPWMGYFFLNWLGELFTIIMVALTSYTILKYRLMDIRIVAKKTFIYFGTTVFVYGILYLTIWVFSYFFDNTYTVGTHIAIITISILFVFSFYGTNKLLKQVANRYFFFELYNYQETINKLSEKLNYYTDLNRIVNSIVFTIKKTMQLNRAGVLLINQDDGDIQYQVAKVVGFNEKNGISLVQDNFLTKHLQKIQAPLVRDELALLAEEARTMKEKESFYKLGVHMKKIEASLCLPLMSSNRLIGIIVLGSKVSGNAYTKEDLELLETLANQAGIAVENARLYKKVQDFNKTLKQKVHEQTKDIKIKAKELEEKNKNLEELLNMKSDFLRVVNHQLNTPISIMKNSLFMIKDKTFTVKKGMEFIEAGLKRIDETINDFWSAFALEGQKIKMNPEETDIKKIISDLIDEKKNLAITKKRGLDIRMAKPKSEVPKLFCDPREITQAISNLLENAVHYTSIGHVEVSFKEKDPDMLKILITDTGSGIPQRDQKNLFKKFSRGSTSTRFYANGSGLGLYIAKKIVEGNNGQLKLEKTEVGHGTTFSITLPIHKRSKASIEREERIRAKEKSGKKGALKKGKKKTILFVEDEKSFADIYSNYFNKNGYDFKVVYDTENAIEALKKIKVDLILTDIVIPQKNPDGSISNVIAEQGWDFIKKVKKNDKIKNIPIIVFTNLNSEQDRQKAKKLSTANYVVKNQVDPGKLVKIIEETI